MAETALNDDVFAVEQDIFSTGLPYARALTQQGCKAIGFRTGAGHIYFDLLNYLPVISQLEDERQAFAHLIEHHVYPLAARLYAQAVCLLITVSQQPLAPPESYAELATFTGFDARHGLLRHGFLSPHHATEVEALTISEGISVICQPLNYYYHQHEDARGRGPGGATSNLPVQYYANRNKDPVGGYEIIPPFVPHIPLPRPNTATPGAAVAVFSAQSVPPNASNGAGSVTNANYLRLMRLTYLRHPAEASTHAWSLRLGQGVQIGGDVQTAAARLRPVAKSADAMPPAAQPHRAAHFKYSAERTEASWYGTPH